MFIIYKIINKNFIINKIKPTLKHWTKKCDFPIKGNIRQGWLARSQGKLVINKVVGLLCS